LISAASACADEISAHNAQMAKGLTRSCRVDSALPAEAPNPRPEENRKVGGLGIPPGAVWALDHQMSFVERCFTALAVVGFLGLIAVVTWMMMN
jgi:hypothetical protein